MGNFTYFDIGVLVLYFGAMAALGPLFASKAKTTEGYFLGDRSFPGWLIGFSMFATSISSVTFVAYPADTYKAAWYRMTPNLALPIAIVLAAYVFLPFFRRTHITSAYEYLEGRFGPMTRAYAALAFILMQVIRVSMILYLVSVLIQEITGFSAYYSIVMGGVITSFYTILGGIRAVVWTDFIQAIVLWGGGILCLFVIITRLDGGIGQIFDIAAANDKFSMSDIDPATKQLVPVPWGPDFTQKTVSLLFFVGLSNWLLEYSANQNVIQRYAATRNAHQARVAIWTNCLFSLPTWALFMFIGTALYAFYQQVQDDMAAKMLTGELKPEHILPHFVINELPPGLTGLVIAAVLAAAMSSLSSSINSTSAVGVVDLYKRHFAKDRTDSHYVLVAKMIGLAMGVVMIVGAILLTSLQTTTLQDTATVLTALTSGGLLGIYMLGFFTKRGDDRALIPAIVITAVFTLWNVLSGMKVMEGVVANLNSWTDMNLAVTALNAPIHSYYVGLLSHVLLFFLAYGLGLLLPRRHRELTNLTVYTQDATPLD
jgi:SSS family solute:Na+ symporter